MMEQIGNIFQNMGIKSEIKDESPTATSGRKDESPTATSGRPEILKILETFKEADEKEKKEKEEKEMKRKEQEIQRLEKEVGDTPAVRAQNLQERHKKNLEFSEIVSYKQQAAERYHRENAERENKRYAKTLPSKTDIELNADLGQAKNLGDNERVLIIEKELICRQKEKINKQTKTKHHREFYEKGQLVSNPLDIFAMPNAWIDTFGCAKLEQHLDFYGMDFLLATQKEKDITRAITTTINYKKDGNKTAIYTQPKEIFTRNNEIVRLYGREFHAKDLLWMAVLLKKTEMINFSTPFLRITADEMLGLAKMATKTTANREALKRFMRRAETTHIEVENALYKFRGPLVVSVVKDKISNVWSFTFNSEIVHFFAENFTLLRLESLSDLKNDTARSVLIRLLSNPQTFERNADGYTEYKPKFYTWKTLYRYAGVQVELKKFKFNICQPEIQEQMKNVAHKNGFIFEMDVKNCTEQGVKIGIRKYIDLANTQFRGLEKLPRNTPEYENLLKKILNTRALPFHNAVKDGEEEETRNKFTPKKYKKNLKR